MKLSLPILALQGAIYDRLSDILDVGVYETAPPETALPYAGIGEFSCTAESLKSVPVIVVTGTIHVWTEQESMEDVTDISNDVLESFTNTPLTVTLYPRSRARACHTDTPSPLVVPASVDPTVITVDADP